MPSSIIGKTCPFCQFPIKDEADITNCSSCQIPHHRECWAENGGCTTFGCRGLSTENSTINDEISQEHLLDSITLSISKKSIRSLLAVIALCIVLFLFFMQSDYKAQFFNINFDGGTYRGDLRGGIPYGQGVWQHTGGEGYSGNWRDGEYHGYGIWTGFGGEQYTGNWKDGIRDGKGVWQHPSGEKYDGNWRNGKYHGYGVWNGSAGEKYTGNWEDGKRDGKGVWQHPSGEGYDGEWQDDEYHGYGVWSGSAGEKYAGNWEDGKRHGRGTYTDRNGKVEKGLWVTGSQAPNYIASIDAEVIDLRFFEEGYVNEAFDSRKYSERFARREARYICYELNLSYPLENSERNFDITRIIYNPNGSVRNRNTRTHRIPSGWSGSYHWSGWGWKNPGNWPVGIYKMELIADGKVVASGQFTIY